VTPQKLSLSLTLTAAVYFVDAFVRWVEDFQGSQARLTGWELQIATWGALAALALLLVELARGLGLWRTAGSALLTVLLALGTGLLVVGALVHLRWGYVSIDFSHWAYGAWLALACGVALVGLGWLRLTELRTTSGERVWR
jgi:hypothetical protein